MRTLLTLGLLAAAATFTGREAQANWCVYYDAYTYNCGFSSLRQCQATSLGGGGQCRRDPYAVSSEGRDGRESRTGRSRERDRR
jgi:hypothetical protein